MTSATSPLRRIRPWEWLLAIALPAIVLSCSFAFDGIFPFGQTSVCVADMDLQYVGLFGWLSRVMHGEGSLLYSMASGYGGNTLALVAYYLASPLSAFLALFDYTQAAEYLSYMTIVKVAIAGLTGYAFLRYRYGAGSVSVALAVSYALCGYSLGQASNIMWLDGVFMLPLIAMGVRMLVARGRAWPLFVAVAVATLANWYSAYMDCIFAVIYFFVCRVECGRKLRDHFWRDGGPFAATMVLGLGMSMVLFLPAGLDLTAGVESDLSFLRLLDPRLCVMPWHMFGYLACGSTGGYDGMTPYYATAGIVVVLALARFFVRDSRPHPRRRKLALGVMLALCFGGVVFCNVSIVWSCLRYATSFMYRHSYTITFALVICAREAWDLLRADDPAHRRHLLACCAIAVMAVEGVSAALTTAVVGTEPTGLFAWFTARNVVECATSSPYLLAGGVLTVFATAAAIVVLDGRESGRTTLGLACAAVVLVGAICGECYINARVAFGTRNHPAAEYGAYWQKLEDATNEAAAPVVSDNEPKPLVGVVGASYRGDRREGGPTTTEGLAVGMQATTEYTSTVHGVTQSLWRHLGYFSSDKAIFGYAYNCPQPVGDVFLGVDAVIDREATPGLSYVGPSALEGYNVYACENRLPFAWGAADGATGSVVWSEDNAKPFANQLAVLHDATQANVRDVYTNATVELSPVDDAASNVRAVNVTCNQSGPLYLNLPKVFYATENGHFQTTSNIYVNGRRLQEFGFNFDNNVMYAGTYEAGQTVEVKLELGDNFAYAAMRWREPREFRDTTNPNDIVTAVTFDAAALKQALAEINTTCASNVNVQDGRVSMTTTVDKSTLVVCSLGYDKGWSATIDGQPVDVMAAYEGLCGIQVPAGTHEVVLTYTNPGLLVGAAASIGCLVVFLVWRLVANRRRARRAAA